MQEGPAAGEGVGHALVTSRGLDATRAAALSGLLEAVGVSVHRGDIVGARAAARALVAYLDALPPTAGSEGQVMKLAEQRSRYGAPERRAA